MMSVLIATMKRNRIIAKRVFPWSFIVERFINGFFIVLSSFFVYYYLFRRGLDPSFTMYTGNTNYLGFIILGAADYTFAVSILMNTGRSLMNELREGTLETLLLAPASRIGYFLGTFVEQIGRSSLQFIGILVMGWLLGIHFPSINIGDTLLVFLLSLVSFFGMGICLAGLMLHLRDTYITQNTLFIIMSFLSGIAFPVQYLPYWLQTVSHLFPLSSSLKLFRYVILSGHSLTSHLDLVLELAGLSIVYGFIGLWWLAKLEKKLLENMFA